MRALVAVIATLVASSATHALRNPALPRPADWLSRRVRAGLPFAIIIAGVLAVVHNFETSRECRGAFSGGFSNGFDHYRCVLKNQH